MAQLYNRIAQLCEKQGITVTDLCRFSGAPRGSLTDLKQGRKQSLSTDTLQRIAEYFGVSVDYLLGNSSSRSGGVLVPIYGRIAAGIPFEAITMIEDYEEISEALAKTGDFFGLRICGKSMEPYIPDKAVIICRKQETCEDGDICAVLINGDDATCKKIKKTPKGVYLIPNNQAYDPMFYSNNEIESLPVRIIGKVVEVRIKYESV
ncbi:MAG: helix-turn-helix domain-containing protein [Clostridia bacterium]|nr:helix-turn-helix domain-containing protein [Clostridia bacterium]